MELNQSRILSEVKLVEMDSRKLSYETPPHRKMSTPLLIGLAIFLPIAAHVILRLAIESLSGREIHESRLLPYSLLIASLLCTLFAIIAAGLALTTSNRRMRFLVLLSSVPVVFYFLWAYELLTVMFSKLA
jgi:hypothetical protein